MRSIVKNTVICLLVAVALTLSSCSKQGSTRQRREKFQVVSLDKVNGSISEGWRVTLTVANNTASNVRITDADAYIRYNGRKVARVTVDGEVTLPRRKCSQVEVPLRLTLSNPIAAFSLLNRVRKGDYSGITIDYSLSLGAFASHRIFEQEGVSLEQLAHQFNFGLKR